MRNLICLAVTALIATNTCGLAQTPDRETIVKSLEPKPLTRSMSRGLVVKGETPKVNQDPQINLSVSFDYGSAELLRDGKTALNVLAEALKDNRLARMQFRVIGHTDARGGEEYNLTLSNRRADAVRAYLINHQVEPARLISEGKGMTQLFDPTRPDDAINRRVQIVNMMNVPTN